MKSLHRWTMGAVTMLLAFTSCTSEVLLPDVQQKNETHDLNACLLMGDDFLWEGGETRTSLTIKDNVAKFSWTAGDRVGILPDAGAQVFFTIPEPEEGEELTNTATFDGGAWALKAESNYAAYYPFVKDFDLDRTKVPVNYTGQKQIGTSTAHLGAYDFQGARPETTNENGGGVTFDFDHVGALVLLKFTVPDEKTDLKSVTLSTEGATFITEGTYDLTSDNGFPITATETSESMTVGVDYTTTTANEEVTVYFMCAPVDLSGKQLNVSVAYGDEGETLNLVVDGKKMLAGKGYMLAEQPIPYLTFSANSEQKMTVNVYGGYTLDESLQYSVGGGAWTQVTAGNAISFGGEGNDLRLRGKSSMGTAESISRYSSISFTTTAVKVACTGDIRTLVDYTNYSNANTANARFCKLFCQGCGQLTSAPTLPATILAESCYQYMFDSCTSLTTAPELPATTLAESCYDGMFYGCTSLITAPELPATTLTTNCYNGMFRTCYNLTVAPELPATTLAEGCYEYMFYDCDKLAAAPELSATTLAKSCYHYMFYDCYSLSEAPELPATTLAESCYSGMFYRCGGLTAAPVLPATTLAKDCYREMFHLCTSLTETPELPATSLAAYCYYGMFIYCTGLTEAPVLPATTLAEYCYGSMFENCNKLNKITMLATDISATGCLGQWVRSIATTGTFTKAAGMTSLPEGMNGIPSGWTVVSK